MTRIIGTAGDDTIFGTEFRDTIKGAEGDDTLNGLAGADRIVGGAGDDLLLGGLGRDRLKGQAGDDTLFGEKGDDLLFGGDGADRLEAGDGDDQLHGGDGADQLLGGDGNDTADGEADADVLDGGSGDDRLLGGSGADQLSGGDGNDTLDGGDDDDRADGGTGDDSVAGGDGDDTLIGGDGADVLEGGTGEDRLIGGAGDDWLDGGGDDDLLVGGDGHDTLFGGDGDDRLFGQAGDDRILAGDGDDLVKGGDGDDGLKGEDGNDVLIGEDGEDRLKGGAGDDRLIGGTGNDVLKGGVGDDSLAGGRGDDRVAGGGGNDEASYVVADNRAARDDYDGGTGVDVLTLKMCAADWFDPRVQTDIAAYLRFLDDHTDPATGEADAERFYFTAFDLVASRFEGLRVVVDGVDLDPADQPVDAVDDAVSIGEDARATRFGSVLGNDAAPDLVHEVRLVSGVSDGLLTFRTGVAGAPDGRFCFDPDGAFDYLAAGESREVSFVYTVVDADGDTDQATVVMTVVGRNDDPTAVNDTNAHDPVVEQGTAQPGDPTATGNVLDNDRDVDATDRLRVTSVDNGSGPTGPDSGRTSWEIRGKYGVLTMHTNGTWFYMLDDSDPDTEALEDGSLVREVFTYAVDDGHGGSDEAKLRIAIQGALDNVAPVAEDDRFTVEEDVVLRLDILANDTDDNGDGLAVAKIDGSSVSAGDTIATDHGVVTVLAGGKVSYRPDADYSGRDSFTYEATDGRETSGEATVMIDVGPVADRPRASLVPDGDPTPLPSGTDVRVNSTTSGEQNDATVAALKGGGFVVTWSSDGQDGDGRGIYGQRYDTAGNPAGTEFRVNATTVADQMYASVVALDDGGWVVTWSSAGQDGDGWGVFSQRYDGEGNAVGGETRVNGTTASDQLYSDAAALSDGGYVIVWQSAWQDGEGYGIFARRFDADGNAVGDEIPVNTHVTSDQIYGDVVALADGGWLVTWSSYGQDGSSYGIFAQRFDEDGNAVGGEVRVNTETADQQIYSDAVALADGGWVVTWSAGDGDQYGIFAQRYDADGNPVGGETRVNTCTDAHQLFGHAIALDDGGWLVTWTSVGQDGSGEGLYCQRYDSDGVAVGGETLVNARVTGDQTSHGAAGGDNVALLANGQVVTVYDDGTGDVYYVMSDMPSDVDGLEDRPLAVGLAAGLRDVDGSETLTLVLTGYPAGAAFSLGVADGASWVIEDAQTLDLATLTMTPPADWTGRFTLTVTATATERANGDTAQRAVSAVYVIAPVNEPPVYVDDPIATGEDMGGTVAARVILAYDTAADLPDGLTVSDPDAVSQLSAAVAMTPNGRFAFEPTPAVALQALEVGDGVVDAFDDTVEDGSGLVDTAPVFISVDSADEFLFV